MKRKSISKKTRQEVLNKYNGKCAYCGCELDLKTLRVDHIEPVYAEGKCELENFNPSCFSCNYYKSAWAINSFRGQLGLIVERLNKIFIFRLAVKYGLITINKKDIVFKFEEDIKGKI